MHLCMYCIQGFTRFTRSNLLSTAGTWRKSFPGPLISNVAGEKRWRIVSAFYSWHLEKILPRPSHQQRRCGEEVKDCLHVLQLTTEKNPYPSHKQRCHFIFHQIALMYYEDFLVFIAMKTTFLVNEAQTEYLTLLYNLVLVSTRRTQIIH